MRKFWESPTNGMNGELLSDKYYRAQAIISAHAESSDDLPSSFNRLTAQVEECLNRLNEEINHVEKEIKKLELLAESVLTEGNPIKNEISPEAQGILALALTECWLKKPLSGRYNSFISLTQHSWFLENLWTDAVIELGKHNHSLTESVVCFAESQLESFDNRKTQALVNSERSVNLSSIWRGDFSHSYEIEMESWHWIEILWGLDKPRLSKILDSFQSVTALSSILASPLLSKYFDVWSYITSHASPCFSSDGNWNQRPLLPVMIKHALSKMSDYQTSLQYTRGGEPKEDISSIRAEVSTVLKNREDYEGLALRLGIWLTRQLITTSPESFDNEILAYYSQLLNELVDKVDDLERLKKLTDQHEQWESWVHHSMLALIASERNYQYFKPFEAEPFIRQWVEGCDGWLSEPGRTLRAKSQLFIKNTPCEFSTMLLGYSFTLLGNYHKNWKALWEASFPIRDLLESGVNISDSSPDIQPYEASRLTKLLLDIGIGILDAACEHPEKKVDQICYLFEQLWCATSEMISIDPYGDDFLSAIQHHLIIRRAKWSESNLSSTSDLCSTLDEKLSISHPEVLSSLKGDTVNLINTLSLYSKNGIADDFIVRALGDAKIEIKELYTTAKKLYAISNERFNIKTDDLKLLESLALIRA